MDSGTSLLGDMLFYKIMMHFLLCALVRQVDSGTSLFGDLLLDTTSSVDRGSQMERGSQTRRQASSDMRPSQEIGGFTMRRRQNSGYLVSCCKVCKMSLWSLLAP